MISQTAEYALRAVVDLAFHEGRSRTTRQISQATRVPVDYLAKILKDLGRFGLVRARRGPGGGFVLARDRRDITVYDVLLAVDPPRRIRSCPLHLKAHAHALCPLHQRLDDAASHIEKIFRASTIADITARPQAGALDGAGNGERHDRGGAASSGTSRRVTLTSSISGGLAVPPRPSRRRPAASAQR